MVGQENCQNSFSLVARGVGNSMGLFWPRTLLQACRKNKHSKKALFGIKELNQNFWISVSLS
jgi:hypothetical protein